MYIEAKGREGQEGGQEGQEEEREGAGNTEYRSMYMYIII